MIREKKGSEITKINSLKRIRLFTPRKNEMTEKEKIIKYKQNQFDEKDKIIYSTKKVKYRRRKVISET
jgi:hypothetical protein